MTGWPLNLPVLLAERRRLRTRTESPWPRVLIGFATGTLSTATGVSAPPLALWLGSRQMRPSAIRDSITAARSRPNR